MKVILYYLTQPSTLKGLVRWIVGGFLYWLSPQAQDLVTEVGLQAIGAAFAINGAIDVIRNERKALKPPPPEKLPWRRD